MRSGVDKWTSIKYGWTLVDNLAESVKYTYTYVRTPDQSWQPPLDPEGGAGGSPSATVDRPDS